MAPPRDYAPRNIPEIPPKSRSPPVSHQSMSPTHSHLSLPDAERPRHGKNRRVTNVPTMERCAVSQPAPSIHRRVKYRERRFLGSLLPTHRRRRRRYEAFAILLCRYYLRQKVHRWPPHRHYLPKSINTGNPRHLYIRKSSRAHISLRSQAVDQLHFDHLAAKRPTMPPKQSKPAPYHRIIEPRATLSHVEAMIEARTHKQMITSPLFDTAPQEQPRSPGETPFGPVSAAELLFGGAERNSFNAISRGFSGE